MDYTSALALKQSVSEDIIGSARQKIARVFSFGSLSLRSIRLSRELRFSVNGVGIAKTADSNYQLKILTRSRLFSREAVASYYDLYPEQVSVRKAGPIRLLAYTGRVRPAFPGVSIGHGQVSAGTLGCFVKKPGEDVQYLLSNNHILANLNECTLGDPIYQPGKIDGAQASDVVARLADFEPLALKGNNLYDAAIARMEAASSQTDIPGIGRVTGLVSPHMHMRVWKAGRSSGLTQGLIVSRRTDIEVDFGDGRKLVFYDQFEIEGRKEEQLAGFSINGDSGSLIVEAAGNRAVGLLFAADDTGNSYANQIEPIFKRFGVVLV